MDILYLNAKDIEQIALTDAEIIGAIEDSLRAQGNGQTSIEPRVHINPDPAYNGHFNVLRGYIAPKHVAGVKVVGDYVYNYKLGLPSELSLLNLFDPETGAPYAVIDATAITSMRTRRHHGGRCQNTLPKRRTRSLDISAAAARRSGMSFCWILSMILRKFASTVAARNPWMHLPSGWRTACTRRSPLQKTARSVLRAPILWSRRPPDGAAAPAQDRMGASGQLCRSLRYHLCQ